MGNVIDFEEAKADRELVEMLDEFEKIMPTQEEIEISLNRIRDKYDLNKIQLLH